MTAPNSSRRPHIIAIALACAGAILVAASFERGFAPGTPGRIALALVQVAATVTTVVAIARTIARLDAMLQRVMLEAFAIAFAGAGLLASGSGFLERAGLPRIDWGLWMWPVMVVLWAVGLVIARARYR